MASEDANLVVPPSPADGDDGIRRVRFLNTTRVGSFGLSEFVFAFHCGEKTTANKLSVTINWCT